MSGLLRVRVNASVGGPGLDDGIKVVGNIYATSPGGRGRRSVLFPLGASVAPAVFAVEAGSYLVETTLPSGELLTEQVGVDDGGSASVELGAVELGAAAPHDAARAFQHVLGNVLPAPAVPPAQNPTEAPGGPARHHGFPQPAPRAEPARLVRLRTTEPGTLSYRRLNEAAGLAPAGAAAALEAAMEPAGPPEAPVPGGEGFAAIYRFGREPTAGGATVPAREFLLVAAAGHRTLATLPLPWRDVRGRDAEAEVVVHGDPVPATSRISVTVRDPDLATGLAYLAAGNLAKAAAVFAPVDGMLTGAAGPDAVGNPLAAAAAGYLFLGTGSPGRSADWYARLPAISRQAPLLGDPAILEAALRLREATTAREHAAAKEHAKAAFHRGLPVFTPGLAWLTELLAEFPEDPECELMLAEIRRLSWRAEMREPFVVLELGGGRRD